MSIVDPKPVAPEYLPIPVAGTPKQRERDPTKRLHRVATVRKQQGVSLRSIARQTRMDARELSSQEKETTDLRLSDLYRWEQALGVPVSELLLDSGTQLSRPILERARMVRIMKTVKSLLETARTPTTQRLAETLFEQMVEIMPELREVSPWHSVGQRRSLHEYGRAAERVFSTDVSDDDLWDT